MPPPGKRICLDADGCVHGEDTQWDCRTCITNAKRTYSRGNAYFCKVCRDKLSYKGIKLPKKPVEVDKKPAKTAKKKVKEVPKSFCQQHKSRFLAENACGSCVQVFQSKQYGCNHCRTTNPLLIIKVCPNHKKYWDTLRSRWTHNEATLKMAIPYPNGHSDDFLKTAILEIRLTSNRS